MTNSEERIGCSKEKVSRVEEAGGGYVYTCKQDMGWDHIKATVLPTPTPQAYLNPSPRLSPQIEIAFSGEGTVRG
jgi:hypothetical protein